VAEAVEFNRKAQANNAARQVGLRIGQPNTTVGDMALLGAGNQSEIFSLPSDPSEWMPMQDLDPASPTFGMLRFIVDVDQPGNPNRWYP